MRPFIILFSTLLAYASIAAPIQVTLDGSAPGEVFQGIGATSGGGATSRLLVDYPQTQRNEILDYLFTPHYGASLQLLKVEIGSDANSTQGSEPTYARTSSERNFERGYEWWLIDEAKRRNPNIQLIALAWNFPAWVQTANSQRTADYIVAFLEGALQKRGIVFDYVGIWNETKMDVSFIKTLHATIAAHGLRTKIIADDSVNSWDLVASMDADSDLRGAVDVIATHYPRWLSTPLAREKSKEWTKPLWSSEDGPWGDTWGTAGQQAPPLAQILNRNYLLGRMTSTNIWNLETSYYDIFELPNGGLLRAKTPWSGNYILESPLWVVAHTTQFAQPGWRYVDSGSAIVEGVGSYVTLHNQDRYSVIIESLDAKTPRLFTFRIKGGLGKDTVYVWRSNAQRWFERIATVQPKNGAFSVTIEPNSVYTLTNTTGQHKGVARPPQDAEFPIPYRDNFETVAPGRVTPRYLYDVNGAFEIDSCPPGRAGHCLRQMTDGPPIAWTYYGAWPTAGTLATLGDLRWRDYRVAAQVLVDSPGYAALYGRISRVTSDGVIDAYQFRLYDDGRWELRASANESPIRSGRTDPSLRIWRHLELQFQGTQISASVDGKEVISVTDQRRAAGLAGIGDGWNRAFFDDLELTPIANGVPVISPLPSVLTSVPPELPPELLVPQPGDHVVRLTWKPTPGATGYRVRIGIKEDTFDKVEDAGNVLTYTFRTLTNGLKYFFNVSALNDAGEGKPSPTQFAVPQAPRNVP